MLINPIENRWIEAFATVFDLCKVHKNEAIVILCESQSRAVNVQLAELALQQLGLSYFSIKFPTPADGIKSVLRSTGASQVLNGQQKALEALCNCDVVIDLTLEGLMHAPQTAKILGSGARIMNISNEHPEILARLIPKEDLKQQAKDAVALCRSSKTMSVLSSAGSDLKVDMQGAATVGIWGWTDRPGTLAHWPGGIVVSFPKAGSVNGTLVYQPGDMNLTFKRYFDSSATLVIENDYVIAVEGNGTDAALMRDYYASFEDPLAYATSHVGWGFNPDARYEALTMYDKCDINCTELRAVEGNFLYSTGANEFAERFTRGHFDLPLMQADIKLDDTLVVENGQLK